MGRVNQQIHDHLADLLRPAEHRRDITQLQIQLGHVFDFISHHVDRAPDALVQVTAHGLGGLGPRKAFQILDNFTDPFGALQRLSNQPPQILDHIIELYLALQSVD